MPDYRELYLTMVRETEKAISILIDAQKKCEDLYINSQEPEIKIFDNKVVDPDLPK
ncbi:MAG: hypothetical protein HFE44_07685 [Oscillospiraceae bacterium]|jgi:hypothetical protein|nr:hypothetical protein [Oscillospiraceae bacterium]